MVKVPHTTLERKLYAKGFERVIGVDEVGMGCMAGPVVVCAAWFPKAFYERPHPALARLRESKLLSARQREVFARELTLHTDIRYAVSIVHAREVDTLNVFQAARTGMRRAISKLRATDEYSKVMVLVDGPHRIADIPHEQMPIVKGDRTIFAIACASIIAKVHRDAMMVRYAKRYPGYGLERHKGYGTAAHRVSLAALGPCPIHRKTFHFRSS